MLVWIQNRGIDKHICIDDEHILEEYDEVEIVEEIAEPEQRAATGRVITGKDCEYIKLCSITAKSGCTNGEDEDTDQDNYWGRWWFQGTSLW